MPTIVIQTQGGVVPQGFCPEGETMWQQVYDVFLALTQYSLSPDVAFFNRGGVVPTPENRVYPWIRSVGGYPDRTYQWGAGLWLSLHGRLPGEGTIAPPNIKTQAQLDTWDGGQAGPVGLYTGTFWEIDTLFNGRMPIGAGAVPGSDPPLTLAVGDDTGAGSHVMVQTELPLQISLTASLPGHRFAQETLAPFLVAPRASGGVFPTTPPYEVGAFPFDNAGGGKAMSLMPPTHAVMFIRRTARLFYAIPG